MKIIHISIRRNEKQNGQHSIDNKKWPTIYYSVGSLRGPSFSKIWSKKMDRFIDTFILLMFILYEKKCSISIKYKKSLARKFKRDGGIFSFSENSKCGVWVFLCSVGKKGGKGQIVSIRLDTDTKCQKFCRTQPKNIWFTPMCSKTWIFPYI